MSNYELIHFVVGDEHLQPLVQSQVFEQAEIQMKYYGNHKPYIVKVLYYCHYRDFLNGSNSIFLKEYKKKFPSIEIIPIYRTIRLAKYLKAIQIFFRLLSTRVKVIQCRGESAHKEIRTLPFLKLLKRRVILDVRGIWPYEYFLHKGKKDISKLTTQERKIFDELVSNLIVELDLANGLSFVSKNLQDLVGEMTNIWSKNRIIVPCLAGRSIVNCSDIHIDKYNDEIINIVYSGTDRVYQHLEDLVLPFLKLLIEKDKRIRLKILSKDKKSILEKLLRLKIDLNKITLKSVDRSEVFEELNNCALAILLREPSIINKVSSPVKLGEYFSAGLPVLYQKDSIGFSNEIIKHNLGVEVSLNNKLDWQIEAIKVIDFLDNGDLLNTRKRIKQFFLNSYSWESMVDKQRIFYKQVLENNS